MADHPLRSATHRRLGGPLPHQLANGTRTHLYPSELLPLLHAKSWSYAVLAPISMCYPADRGRLFTRYSPVRRWCIAAPARLACVKHAASVRPEPESNSHVLCILTCARFLAHLNIRLILPQNNHLTVPIPFKLTVLFLLCVSFLSYLLFTFQCASLCRPKTDSFYILSYLF